MVLLCAYACAFHVSDRLQRKTVEWMKLILVIEVAIQANIHTYCEQQLWKKAKMTIVQKSALVIIINILLLCVRWKLN